MPTKTFGSYSFFAPPPPHHHPFPSITTNQAKKHRLTRATATQESPRLNQKIFRLPDGPDQRARDDAMRTAMAAKLEGKPIPDGNPNQWTDRTKSRIQFEYDAYHEVERCWTGGRREQVEALGGHADGAHDSSSVGMALKRIWRHLT